MLIPVDPTKLAGTARATPEQTRETLRQGVMMRIAPWKLEVKG
jgi:hypothetical protein